MQAWRIGRVAFWWVTCALAGGAACGDDPDDEAGGDAGGGAQLCDRATAAVRGCGLIDDSPVECMPTARGPGAECIVTCLEAADCATLERLLCDGEVPPTENAAQLMDCYGRCWDQDGFRCASGGQSVDPAYECDGEADCGDGSDEVGCGMLACGDGSSVMEALECDGFEDCASGADELSCERYPCRDGSSVPLVFRCDDVADCADASDESNCLMPLCGTAP